MHVRINYVWYVLPWTKGNAAPLGLRDSPESPSPLWYHQQREAGLRLRGMERTGEGRKTLTGWKRARLPHRTSHILPATQGMPLKQELTTTYWLEIFNFFQKKKVRNPNLCLNDRKRTQRQNKPHWENLADTNDHLWLLCSCKQTKMIAFGVNSPRKRG